MTRIVISDKQLIVEPQGLDKLWSLRQRIVVPLRHVRAATVVDRAALQSGLQLRAPGTYVPGVIKAGTFYSDGERSFWLARRASQLLVIELEHEPYARLILELHDPLATARMIYHAQRDQLIARAV